MFGQTLRMCELRVLIAARESVFAAGLSAVLEGVVRGVQTAPEGATLDQASVAAAADVVFLELSAGGWTGIDELRELCARGSPLRVLAFTAEADSSRAVAAFVAGAAGYVTMGCTVAELLGALEAVARGRSFIAPTVAREVVESLIGRGSQVQSPDKLTVRQLQVLRLISEGHTTAEVAAALSISPKTVASHRYALLKRLNLRTAADLTRYAIRNGVAPME